MQAVFPGARVALLRPGGQECDPGEDREAHSHKHAGHNMCQLITHATHTIHTRQLHTCGPHTAPLGCPTSGSPSLPAGIPRATCPDSPSSQPREAA